MKIFMLIVVLLILFSACATQKMVETDLYFGLSKPDGTFINETVWDNFAAEYISKVYPKGFTQIRSDGKWMDTASHTLIQEPSRIIIVVQKITKVLSAKIDSMTMAYKIIFHQQAVLRVDKKVGRVSF